MTGSLRLAFMGSPDFAVPVLSALVSAGHDIACVYAQPPRKAGRGRQLRATPVQSWADAHGLPVRTPETLRQEDEQAAFSDLNLDAAVVVAYGLILPRAILDAPRLGCLNMHASLLPRWRGAAPIQRALMAGDKETGIQAMIMEAGLDTGPVLATESVRISRQETAGTLHDRLADLAGPLAVRALAGWGAGTLVSTPQSETGMTYAAKINAADQQIDWTQTAEAIDCQIRGLSPLPGAWFAYRPASDAPEIRIKALMSERVQLDLAQTAETQAAGAAIIEGGRAGMVVDERLTVRCGDGGLVRISRLQRPGARPMPSDIALRGLPLSQGTVLA